mmetsp:Transcript_15387/g.18658  ORF Transcript_15387/g.18658 Transcript_15387/m.18658 type:complete len:319 (-) Transcript_15387:334-1290(-)
MEEAKARTEPRDTPWPAEQNKRVNQTAVFVKSVICTLLLIPSISTVILLKERVDLTCVPNNVTGIFYDTAEEDECNMRLFIAALSMVLLIPFVPETVLSSIVLANQVEAYKWKRIEAMARQRQGRSEEAIELYKASEALRRIIFVDGEVGTLASTDGMHGAETIIDRFLKYGFMSALAMSIGFLLLLPFLVLFLPFYALRSYKYMKEFESDSLLNLIGSLVSVVYFLFLLLPDITLTVILFPLSFLVVSTSESVAETFVNLVAVQIFAQLDDFLVKMIVLPRKSIGFNLEGYCDGYIQEYREWEKDCQINTDPAVTSV